MSPTVKREMKKKWSILGKTVSYIVSRTLGYFIPRILLLVVLGGGGYYLLSK